jgi:hypothetical protein
MFLFWRVVSTLFVSQQTWVWAGDELGAVSSGLVAFLIFTASSDSVFSLSTGLVGWWLAAALTVG